MKRNHGGKSSWKSSSALNQRRRAPLIPTTSSALVSSTPSYPVHILLSPPDAALVQWVEHSVYSADHSDIRGALVAGTSISPLVAGASRRARRHETLPLPPPLPAPALLGPPPRRTCPRRVLPQKGGGDSRHQRTEASGAPNPRSYVRRRPPRLSLRTVRRGRPSRLAWSHDGAVCQSRPWT